MEIKSLHKGTEITHGKTKTIFRTEVQDIVFIENNDILSKGDGKELYTLPGKGIWATDTTCNVFELLKLHNIPLAYIGRVDERTFSAYEADMVALEIVVRNVAYGSYLKRNPEVQEGTVLSRPVIEFYYKSDKEGDPFAVYDPVNEQWLLYDPKKPIKDVLRIMPYLVTKKGILIDSIILNQIIKMAEDTNQALKPKWAMHNILLLDFKFEVGFIIINGKVTLVLGDVIDNDSWRIWLLGENLDKEVFRRLKEVTPEAQIQLKENYQLVAELSGQFLT